MLSRVTLAYNTLEGIVSIVAGALAGSISLVGFGVDSVIEVSSSVAALWRLRADAHAQHRARVEAITVRVIGGLFLALALYIAIDAGQALYHREAPDRTIAGIIITAASVIVMPILARAKRRVGLALGSRALTADAMQTSLCTSLSAIVRGALSAAPLQPRFRPSARRTSRLAARTRRPSRDLSWTHTRRRGTCRRAHRLHVEDSSSNSPRSDRNLNTGIRNYDETT